MFAIFATAHPGKKSELSLHYQSNFEEKGSFLLTGNEDHERGVFGKIRDKIEDFIRLPLSKLLSFVFHSRISGKRLKTGVCYAAGYFADLDLARTDSYEDWFAEDAELALPQAGKAYTGFKDSSEYIAFIYSVFIKHFLPIAPPMMMSMLTDDSKTCYIAATSKRQISLNESYYDDGCLEFVTGYSFKFNLTADESYISVTNASIFFPGDFFGDFFGHALHDKVSDYVCSVMENTCEEVWKFNNLTDQESCKEQFLALEIGHGDINWFDGNSQSCRVVHATFAEENPTHCPHISFVPMVDINGHIKCQTSAGLTPSDLFTAEQLDFFERTARNLYGFDKTMNSYTSGECECDSLRC